MQKCGVCQRVLVDRGGWRHPGGGPAWRRCLTCRHEGSDDTDVCPNCKLPTFVVDHQPVAVR